MNTQLVGGNVALTRVGLGGWEFRGGDIAQGEPSFARVRSVIEAGLSVGVGWIDTSEIYFDGRNEALIGAVLQTIDSDIVVSTKLGPRPEGSGFTTEEIESGCRQSLIRLRRERLDVCFLHWPDVNVPLSESWTAMCDLADRGLIRALGLSNYGLDDIASCHARRPVDVVQVGLSLIDYRGNVDVIAGCHRMGIPVVIYEPLANGILTDKRLDDIGVTWGLGFERWESFERLLAPAALARTSRVVEQLRRLAAETGHSVAQLALTWVLSVPGVTAAIVGTTSEGNLVESAGAAELVRDRQLARVLAEIAAEANAA